MKLYLARDLNGRLFLFSQEPNRNDKDKIFVADYAEEGVLSDFLQLDKSSFPEVTWENSPVEMELVPTDFEKVEDIS